SCCQMSIIVLLPWGSSFSLLVAQPPSTATATDSARPRVKSVKFESMAFSCAVIDLATLGVEVDGKGFFEVDSDFRAGLHIDGGEGLPVELVDPVRHFLDATGENPAHGLLTTDAHSADGAVRADVGHLAAVAFDERGHAGTGRGDQGLRTEVLL